MKVKISNNYHIFGLTKHFYMKSFYAWVAANKIMAAFLTIIIIGLLIWFFVWLANKNNSASVEQTLIPEPNNPSRRIADLFAAPRIVDTTNNNSPAVATTTFSGARVSQSANTR